MPLVPTYEVFALRYATQQSRYSNMNFIHSTPINGLMPLDFYIWVIRNKDHTIVVDTGFNQEIASKRARDFLHCPRELLKNLKIDANTVTDVIITHMHYDHSSNLHLFPNAKFHLQEKEMSFCTGGKMSHAIFRDPFEIKSIHEMINRLFDGKIIFHDGDEEIIPGVSVHLIGGHTTGIQAVRIFTDRGYIVLASDCAHYWDNIEQRNPFPIVENVYEMVSGFETLECLADSDKHIIPGHDPKVLKTFVSLEQCHDIVLLHITPIC